MRLRHIAEADSVIAESKYVINEPEKLRGNWQSIFPSKQPLYIEIGMGKGQFITQMALAHPENNYIGIECYSSVLLRAVQKLDAIEAAGEAVPSNLFLVCVNAEHLLEVFEPGEISGIFLNFSDPWPKERHAKRRLTSSRFLDLYAQILPSGSTIEFKTDNRGLFDFSVESIEEHMDFQLMVVTYDLHHDEELCEGNIMTEYEEKFSSQGNPIHKLIAERE